MACTINPKTTGWRGPVQVGKYLGEIPRVR